MNSLIVCSICLEDFKTPKCLPCIHTFCLECLKTYGKDERSGDEMACPLCRKPFKIPQQGFEELPNNFFIAELLKEYTAALSQSQGAEQCDACSGVSSSFCIQCDQHYCATCRASHGKMRATASHKVVSLEEKKSSKMLLAKSRPRFCQYHKDKPIELYCYDCKQVICLMCSVLDHKTHHCKELEEASRNFCDQLKMNFPSLTQCVDANDKVLKQLISDRTSFLSEIALNESAIVERANQLKRLIDLQSQKLLNELEQLKGKRLKEIQTRTEEAEKQLVIVTSFKKYVEELVNKGSACDVAQGTSNLLKRAEELLKDQDAFSKKRMTPVEVIFTAAGHESGHLDEEPDLVGSLTLRGR